MCQIYNSSLFLMEHEGKKYVVGATTERYAQILTEVFG